jgi:hypothetical protein
LYDRHGGEGVAEKKLQARDKKSPDRMSLSQCDN